MVSVGPESKDMSRRRRPSITAPVRIHTKKERRYDATLLNFPTLHILSSRRRYSTSEQPTAYPAGGKAQSHVHIQESATNKISRSVYLYSVINDNGSSTRREASCNCFSKEASLQGRWHIRSSAPTKVSDSSQGHPWFRPSPGAVD